MILCLTKQQQQKQQVKFKQIVRLCVSFVFINN